MKKVLVLFLTAALSAALLAGCGASGAAGRTSSAADSGSASAAFSPSLDTSASAQVKIVGRLDNFEALEAVIKDFNAVYPKAAISYAKMDDYASTMPSQVMGGNPPEIFMSFRSQFEANAGLADATLDLGDLGLDMGILTQGNADACYFGGKLVRVPLALNYQGVAVNTTLLEKEGLAVPTSHADFLNVCGALLDKGYTPLQGFPDTIYPMLFYNELRVRLAREKDSAAVFGALNAGADGSGEYLRKEFELLAEYRDKGYFSAAVNSAIGDSYDKAILHFFEGDTPFLVCSTETFSGMKKRESKSAAFTAKPFGYEFCELPVSDLGATAVVDVWNAFSIAKNSGSVEWAKEFIRFLFTPDELNKIAEVKGLPTAVAAGSGDSRFDSLSRLAPEQLLYSSEANVSGTAAKVYGKLAAMVAAGECSADDAVAQYPGLMKEALKAS